MRETHSSENESQPHPLIGSVLDIQKHDLPPEVRSYADNLEAQVQAIFTEYGCQSWEEFQVLAQDSQRIPIEKMKEVSLLIQTLARVTEHPERFAALKRAELFTTWYKMIGFELQIPGPPVDSDEIERRSKLEIPQALFYRPATKDVSYTEFMGATGQFYHSTTTGPDSKKIAWEPTDTGYWFWAEISAQTPRIPTSWDDLTARNQLLSLEEYVIVSNATQAITGGILDAGTENWLRTRYSDNGALVVCSRPEGLGVVGWGIEALSTQIGHMGGRASEIVNS